MEEFAPWWRLSLTHIVLLVLVALHDGDDAVVDEEGQGEHAGQLGEEQPELCGGESQN